MNALYKRHSINYRLARSFIILVVLLSIGGIVLVRAETELVASLERMDGIVEVKRINTNGWVAINRESLVGVGDSIRTSSDGRARVTFFSSGIETIVEPNSEFRIDEYSGSDQQFKLSVTVVTGQTTQRVNKLLTGGSRYQINSTGLELAVRGTTLDVRVEPSGRSATLIKEGKIVAKNQGMPDASPDAAAEIPAGQGVRAEKARGLSEVVPAQSFTELDAALDGCPAELNSPEDARINVRSGPSVTLPRVGFIEPKTKFPALGITRSTKWIRLPFKGGFGWVYGVSVSLTDPNCPIRLYNDDVFEEQYSRYKSLDGDIVLPLVQPTRQAVPTAKP